MTSQPAPLTPDNAPMRTRRHVKRGRIVTAVAILVAAILAALALPVTNSALNTTVRNTTNTAATGIFTNCTTAATGLGAYFVYPFNDTTGATNVTDVSGNTRTGTYQNTTGITYGVNGPCAQNAVTLNGSTGYISGPTTTLTAPNNFTIQVWFKTNTTRGGKIMGFSLSRTGTSTQYDRHLYMQDNGRLTFGIYNGGYYTISTTAAYNDNAWHHAVATVSNTAGATVGTRLYIDGTLAASDTSLTTPENFTGYWRVGYDNLSGWPNRPTSDYFNGTVAYAAYWQTVLTPTQITNLYNAATTLTPPPSTLTCTNTATTAGAYFVYPLDDANNSNTAADVSGYSRPGTYQNKNGITYQTAGPCPRDAAKSVTLNGTSGHISGPSGAITNPTDFTIQIWFKTNTTTGGKLIGFGNSLTGQSGSYDRHLYMSDDGKINFGVYPNAVRVITSPSAYNDNTWHLAVGTLATTGSNIGQRLYIDGVLVATDITTTTGENFTGYWRIGYDNMNGWTNQPTSFWFKGALAYPAYYNSVLTPTQIADLNTAGR